MDFWEEKKARFEKALAEARSQPHFDFFCNVFRMNDNAEGCLIWGGVTEEPFEPLFPSLKKAKEAIKSGAVYINKQKVTDENFVIKSETFLDSAIEGFKYVTIETGKRMTWRGILIMKSPNDNCMAWRFS